MLAFNRPYLQFGRHVRSLECTDEILEILWRDWDNTGAGGAGWSELGLATLGRSRISTADLAGGSALRSIQGLLLRTDYGIDVVLLREDRAPSYGGWIMAQDVAVLSDAINDMRVLAAEGQSGSVRYVFEPEAGVYRPESGILNLITLRRLVSRSVSGLSPRRSRAESLRL